MKKYIKNLLVFVCICTVMTVFLATTNHLTAPIIEKNQIASTNKSLKEVMPKGENFEKLDITKLSLSSSITEVYKETNGKGYVIKIVTAGYGNDMIIMCGVNMEDVVTGAVCISSNETLGKEKTYGENFINKNSKDINDVDTIAGATKTTKAYKNAVKDALKCVKLLKGEAK